MIYKPPKKTTDVVEVERRTTEESIAAMMGWGYGIQITYNPQHYESPWSVHITKIAKTDNEEPVSAFFGGGSPGTAVQLAYENVAKWQNAKQYPCEDFTERLSRFINSEGLENNSNTPDFILSGMLQQVLNAFNTGVLKRDNWYGVKLAPGEHRCREYDWEHGERVTINVGAIFKIGKRLWRLKELPRKEQGDDLWLFECADDSGGISCDRHHNFTRSEVQWLYSHGAFVDHPVDADGAIL